MAGQVLGQFVVRPVQVVDDEAEVVLAPAQLAEGVRQELRRVPRVGQQRRRLDVRVPGVQVGHDARVDEEQVRHELDGAARAQARVAVEDLDSVDAQFRCRRQPSVERCNVR